MHMGMQQVILKESTYGCPSIIQSLKYSCTMETAVKSYWNHILEVSSPKHLPVKHPRNIKQAKNIWSSILGLQRLSHDALYSLHELAIDNPEFIHTIHTHPNLHGLRLSLFEEFNRLHWLIHRHTTVVIWHHIQVGRFLFVHVSFPSHSFYSVSCHSTLLSYTWQKVSIVTWWTV